MFHSLQSKNDGQAAPEAEEQAPEITPSSHRSAPEQETTQGGKCSFPLNLMVTNYYYWNWPYKIWGFGYKVITNKHPRPTLMNRHDCTLSFGLRSFVFAEIVSLVHRQSKLV